MIYQKWFPVIGVLAFLWVSNSAAWAQSAAAPVEPHAVMVKYGSLELSGLLQIWYQHQDNDPDQPKPEEQQDTLRLRRAEVRLSGEMAPAWNWTVMIDPAKPLKVNQTSATVAGEKVVTGVSVDQSSNVLQELVFTLRFLKPMMMDIGQFKIPVTEEGLRSSAKLDTMERSIIGRTFGDQRDIGLQVRGDHGFIQYWAGVFNGEGRNTADANDQKDLAARVVVRPWGGLEWGGSAYRGLQGKDLLDKNRVGLELRYSIYGVSLKTEYVKARDGETDKAGWYVQAGYRFLSRWEGVVKAEGFDPDIDEGDNLQQDYTVGINYFLDDHHAKAQVNYIHRDEEDEEIRNDSILIAIQVSF